MVRLTGQAFASEPGEWNYWDPEMVNNQGMQVAAQGTLSEARNGGNLLEVWRGATNNEVWLSFNNGPAYTLGTNPITGWQAESTSWQSNYPAQLAAYGAAIYMLFTGLNGLVYYKEAYYNNN